LCDDYVTWNVYGLILKGKLKNFKNECLARERKKRVIFPIPKIVKLFWETTRLIQETTEPILKTAGPFFKTVRLFWLLI
jgi:hypothetical protein